MTEERKAKLQSEVDSSGAKKGFDEIKQGGRDMAQAVGQSAQQAGKAIENIGAGAGASAQKIDAATKTIADSIKRVPAAAKEASAATDGLTQAQARFLASLERQAVMAAQGKAAYLELRAAQLGVGAAAQASLAQLRAAEQGQVQLGMSAKATTAALRGVPAQLTDIVVGLTSGQRPMQVFIQQGGQLKDMFGGIGPAARALGGYIAGLVNPLTLGAAAVAALGVELAHAESNLRQLNSVQALLAGSGRSGLFPTQELKEFISELSKAPGVSRDVATQIVSEFAKAHDIGGALFKDLSQLAADYARATGTDIPTAARTLAKAFSDPAQGAKTLEGALGSLTSAQILAIERFTRLGDVAGAQKVLLESLNASIKGLAEDALTPLQRATNELGNAWERLGERMDHSSGLRSVNEVLAKTVGAVSWLIDHADKVPTWALLAIPGGGLPAALARSSEPTFRGSGATGSFAEPAVAAGAAPGVAASDDDVKRALEAAQAYRSQAGQIADLTEKRAGFNHALQESIALYGKDSEQSKRLRDAIAAIGDQIAKTTGQGATEAADLKAKRLALQQETAQLLADQQRLLVGDTRTDKQTEAAKEVIKLQQELSTNMTAVARAAKERALAEAQLTVSVEQERNLTKRVNEELKATVDTRTKNIDAIVAQSSQIRDAAIAQEAANASTGKSKTAIEEETLARFKAADADKVLAELDPQRHAAMQQRISDQERYVAALRKSESQQISQQLTEGTRVSQEETATLQLQLSLIGQTQEMRERILGQRKVELDLAREIAKIDKSSASEEDKEVQRTKAREKALIDSSNAATKATLDEWQRTADSINSSLTDALLRGFESGKGFAQNFRDTLKNMFATLVLKPIISAALSPVSGALSGLGQSIGSSILGGGGSAVGAGGSLLSSIGSAGSLAALGSSIGTAFTAGSTSVGVMAGSIAGGGGLLGGAASALGAIGPVGWVALAALAAYSLFGGKGGGPKTENGAGLGVRTTGDVASVTSTIKQIQAQYSGIVSGLGGTPGQLDLGIFSAQDPQGTALTQLQVNAALNGKSVYSRDARLGHDNIENVGRSKEELQAAMTEETERVVLSALQASNLTGAVGSYLKQLGDINTLSGGAVEQSLTRAQTIATQQAQLQAQLFDLTHTDLEKLAATRQKERAAIDETNQALYDQIAQLTDLTKAAQDAAAGVDTARGGLADAYQRESSALQSVVQQHSNYAAELRKVRDGLAGSAGAGLSRAQVTARAGQSFQSMLASALTGNDAALQGLGSAGTDLVDAVKQSARSPAEVAAVIARVQAGLTTVASSEDARVTVAQQQLDAMTQQLTALGVINTTVQTVGDALVVYLEAVNRNTAAQATLQAAQLAANGGTSSDPTTTPGATTPASNPAGDVLGAIRALTPFIPALKNLPAFAAGGLPSGAALVGEIGPEVVDFDTPGRVYTNEQTRGMFASNAGQTQLLQSVLTELKALRQEGRVGDVATVDALQKLDARLKKFDIVGMPPVRTP